MSSLVNRLFGPAAPPSPWRDPHPIREELFSVERLEMHAASLAAAQPVIRNPPRVFSLRARLAENVSVLLAAYRDSAGELENGRSVVPAAEWLLDNYHLVEDQVREIREDLPPGYYRQLPKLAEGPFAGYPRVFGLAWAFVAHTDSHIDPEVLRRFIVAYQHVQPLTIGELWAIAITLRIVLVENLRRLADQISTGRQSRAEADALADRLLISGLTSDIESSYPVSEPLSERFAAQLAKRLRDHDPHTTPTVGWLNQRLELQDLSIDAVVQHAQQRQGASNVTVRNVITSMRRISDIDWADLVEAVSLVDRRLDEAGKFAAMNFQTRNLYRRAIEELSRGSGHSELEIVEYALRAARAAESTATVEVEAQRLGDPGFHLIADGRNALERQIGFRPTLRQRVHRLSSQLGIGGYVGGILFVAAILLACTGLVLALAGVDATWVGLFALAAFIPATDLATALVNRAVTSAADAKTLPSLDLSDGVPESLRTLVVIPTLLTSESDLMDQIEQLEVHYLSGGSGDLTFALLLDGVDADTEIVEGEERLLARAEEAINALNHRHGTVAAGERFLLLHRRRQFNSAEGTWMGWERKRGKLHELNRLLRGATDTSFAPILGHPPRVPADVRYVITLDADTRLPRNAAVRLIGKMAHPLNRPAIDEIKRRVVRGYGIIQPRVTASLPLGRQGSFYQDVFSSPGGIDPYAAAVSDVYQDLFGEGSYTGKGIYDIDAFEAALAGRIPQNALLSHDLFEGIFARAGLASDIEVVEGFPSRYDVAAKRQHRWTRGDWQLLPWVLGGLTGGRRIPAIGLGKILDNLRRSLVAPSLVVMLGLSWLLPMPAAVLGSLFALCAMAIPALLPVIHSLLPRRAGIHLPTHVGTLFGKLRLAAAQIFLSLAFLADEAWRMGDAVSRTLVRLYLTRRHLLQWTAAAQLASRSRMSLFDCYAQMAGGTALGVAIAITAALSAPSSWPLALAFGLLWLSAPVLAWKTSQSLERPSLGSPSEVDRSQLRLTARRTWRYFETYVSPESCMLPPDNFQETPTPVVAQRTSPTNIGLYLLSAIAARDFGWAGTAETMDRLEAAFGSMRKLQRYKGHFFNWYGTQDLQPLNPAYVSSVDSGNLAGHLIVVANTCDEWHESLVAPEADFRAGLHDTLRALREEAAPLLSANTVSSRDLALAIEDFESCLDGAQAVGSLSSTLRHRLEKAILAVNELSPTIGGNKRQELLFWIEALRRALSERERDQALNADAQQELRDRMRGLAATSREIALGMDFAFLFDSTRQLLSIGYSFADNRLDPSCYDLLASEARLASLFAIAKGDVPTRHWFRLGRAATPIAGGSALISWSGSMFEYLMPSLVMRAPLGSLLEQTNRLVVARQQAYGRSLGVPWGISESAYNARDLNLTYQYSNFGVPGLGLKRGLSENVVIAPYATGLATMVDPRGAQQNFVRLASNGALGRFGFYEALDFSPSRLSDGQGVAIVRNYMAHHQGMTIVAIANTFGDGRMRERFHREPMIRAAELLLQERTPNDVAVSHPRAEEVRSSATRSSTLVPATRRISVSAAIAGPPITHLLSNGRYAVMLTASGGGYSRWGDIAVTRWREDVTRDDWGSFVFLRDMQSGTVSAIGGQPSGVNEVADEVTIGEDRAAFVRRDGDLTVTMDVVVSGEIDGEVRRVSLANAGRKARRFELTSYAEVALSTQAADVAHPAFSKMLVVTEYLTEFEALIATRRKRSPEEPELWAAHFAVVEGEPTAAPQHESDRSRFLGRGRTVGEAAAIREGRPLSNSTGTVLDPCFSVRERLRIEPGKVARVAFWTVVAGTRADLLGLIDKHRDPSAYDRAKTLAWTQAQVQLRHLDISAGEAADFQRLAAPIIYSDARFRPSSPTILSGAGRQSALWPLSISGDLPIVLLRISDEHDMDQVRQLLRAHEYWRMKQLAVDLVIINDRAASYVQDLQIAIETAVRSSQTRVPFGGALARGAVFTLRADLVNAETRALLRSVARIAFVAHQGSIKEQIARLSSIPARPLALPARSKIVRRPDAPARLPVGLEFFNGLGGFDKNGTEYVTILKDGEQTPAPWINVIANPGFGFQVSAAGGGYTWAENSRENQLTPWSNDPVTDPPAEALYVRDLSTGDLWGPTAQPTRDGGTFVARHGFGYSRFEHDAHGIALDLLQYVPLADPIKISRLCVRNLTNKSRLLSITGYAEWVLGTSRGASAPHIVTSVDPETGALFVRNPWSNAFHGRVAFADLGGKQTSLTADRTEFIGRNGGLAEPAALARKNPLSGATGGGLDPCAALQCTVELGPGQSTEILWMIGQGGSPEEARALIGRYRSIDQQAVFAEVTQYWATLRQSVQVKSPDRAMDILLNGWLLYQTVACRLWARSGAYQASGAYGFRDQLQDHMALMLARPDETRKHILRAAARQFAEGDLQHWWLPHSGQGVRTRISDDRVWLAFATAEYVAATGDAPVLDEILPFLEGQHLREGEHDAFFEPTVSDEVASLFEHCARALDQSVELTGTHGLPLIGTGDWNDGFNRMGAGGKGESVWLAWFLAHTIDLFAPLAEARDPARAERWRAHAASLRDSIEREAWDGEWYRRATYDDGTWVGSKASLECQIDSIAQSWSVLAGNRLSTRAAKAMASLEKHLIRPDDGLALLFWPPFNSTPLDPGYIKGYPPGLRENGGQYSHAAMWAILAFAKLGDGGKAHQLFSQLNPINHARTSAEAARYKVEPYVVAGDIYSVGAHAGRGGWTWYTGAAGWMYRAGIEGILGIRREGNMLVVEPCIPDDWPGFDASVSVDATQFQIRVRRSNQGKHPQWYLDGVRYASVVGGIRVPIEGELHSIEIEIPSASRSSGVPTGHAALRSPAAPDPGAERVN